MSTGSWARTPTSEPGEEHATQHGHRKRVLIVDDHPLVRRGLRELLREEPSLEVCGEVEDVPGALDAIEQMRPHLVIVDLTLKEGHGLALIREVSARYPNILMLAISMHDEKLYAERALRAGALGYVQKQERAETILEALREVQAGRVYVSGPMADELVQRLVGHTRDRPVSPVETLTDREVQVLEAIGQGLTTSQIATRLHLSPKTISTHASHLKSKLRLRSAKELVRFAVARTVEGE